MLSEGGAGGGDNDGAAASAGRAGVKSGADVSVCEVSEGGV